MRFLQETIDTSLMLSKHRSVKSFCVAGSSLIDPESAKDLDFLVLCHGASFTGTCPDWDDVADDIEPPPRWAFGHEWHLCGGEYDDQDDKWGAIRKGVVNLIVTVDEGWYTRAKMANEVCVALKLKDKGDRIVTYRVIRDGYDAESANARRDGTR